MTKDLAAEFRRFAEEDCSGRVGSSSRLYEHLSLRIADDSEMLRLATDTREEQPAPMVLLAAVQYLLFNNSTHRLASFYPSVDGETRPVDDTTYPAFKQFCNEYEAEVRKLVSTRRVQTNTVRRSACLLPAFEYVSRAVSCAARTRRDRVERRTQSTVGSVRLPLQRDCGRRRGLTSPDRLRASGRDRATVSRGHATGWVTTRRRSPSA